MIKHIIWDFDGVILNSANVRDDGFRAIFSSFNTQDVEAFIAYHQRNGGLSRFEKIAYFFNEILHQHITEEAIKTYSDDFSEIMQQKLTNPQYLIEDTIHFIKQHYQHKHFYIASGSEQNELRFLCENLHIAQYFQGIYGSPTKKADIIAYIITENAYNKDECILIGDSVNDYQAAMRNDIRFYGYNNPLLQSYPCPYIQHFADFIC